MPPSQLKRLAAMLAITVAGGLGVTFCLLPEPPPPKDEVPTPTLAVAGHPLASDGDAVGNALDLVRRYALSEVKLVLPDVGPRKPGDPPAPPREVAVTPADFGLEIDRVRLSEFVREALRPGSALARAHAATAAGTAIDVPLPLKIDGERAVSKLVDLKALVDSFPRDAAIDLEGRTVRPEEVGYRLDVYGTLARLESALRRGETKVDAVVEEVKPARTAAELAGVKFDAVLGFFETRYNTAQKSEARSYNLRLAASKLDGRVVMPGEVFDFNAVVGPRDEAHGYKVAPVIAQGELVDGIGGGTCQISGTLHAAAFFAGLEIVERYPHSRPSSYIKLGLDATVSYPNITYRFRNPFDFPVVLHEKVQGGVVRAEILGPERKLTVTYFRRIDDVLPFEETERESDKLAKGERVVVQRGIPGFVATASRLVRNGAYGERTKWTEKYPPTTQIVLVGTGPEDAKSKIKEDAHPEYLVDEYLVVTEGPGVKDDGLSEARTPGRTGEDGWIEKLGFQKTPLEADKKKDDDKDADKKDADKKDDGAKPKDKKKDKKKKDKKAKKAVPG
ncbi:MAG TPA: VanW family protein [Polyangiaceae bacterium]|nr:VanW family protein [Polyangiaceae bacterium]